MDRTKGLLTAALICGMLLGACAPPTEEVGETEAVVEIERVEAVEELSTPSGEAQGETAATMPATSPARQVLAFPADFAGEDPTRLRHPELEMTRSATGEGVILRSTAPEPINVYLLDTAVTLPAGFSLQFAYEYRASDPAVQVGLDLAIPLADGSGGYDFVRPTVDPVSSSDGWTQVQGELTADEVIRLAFLRFPRIVDFTGSVELRNVTLEIVP